LSTQESIINVRNRSDLIESNFRVYVIDLSFSSQALNIVRQVIDNMLSDTSSVIMRTTHVMRQDHDVLNKWNLNGLIATSGFTYEPYVVAPYQYTILNRQAAGMFNIPKSSALLQSEVGHITESTFRCSSCEVDSQFAGNNSVTSHLIDVHSFGIIFEDLIGGFLDYVWKRSCDRFNRLFLQQLNAEALSDQVMEDSNLLSCSCDSDKPGDFLTHKIICLTTCNLKIPQKENKRWESFIMRFAQSTGDGGEERDWSLQDFINNDLNNRLRWYDSLSKVYLNAIVLSLLWRHDGNERRIRCAYLSMCISRHRQAREWQDSMKVFRLLGHYHAIINKVALNTGRYAEVIAAANQWVIESMGYREKRGEDSMSETVTSIGKVLDEIDITQPSVDGAASPGIFSVESLLQLAAAIADDKDNFKIADPSSVSKNLIDISIQEPEMIINILEEDKVAKLFDTMDQNAEAKFEIEMDKLMTRNVNKQAENESDSDSYGSSEDGEFDETDIMFAKMRAKAFAEIEFFGEAEIDDFNDY